MEKFKGIILVSDMDGTMINSRKKISDKDIEAIEYFKNNGGLFTIATGRMLPSANRYAKDLGLSLPIILYNGSKIYDYKTDEVLKEYYLEEERKSVIDRLMKIENIGIEVYSEENIYIFKSCPLTERFSKLGYNVIYNITEEVWKKKWTKILIVGDKEEIDKFEEDFSAYDSEIPIRSGDAFLEIVPKYTSKGAALKELLKIKGLEKYIVVTVGDNMNDVELIEDFTYGFTIGNGTERLVKKASLLAPFNDESPIDYIVKWIEKNLI